MRVGSLFAGIGGFDLAAERAGMEVVWQSEIDAKASAVLAHHWPEVPNYGDIHNMGRPSGRGLQQSHLPSGRSGVPGGNSDVRSTDDGDPSPPIGGTNDRNALPGVDVLTGGFPCQDYSVAGNRGGLAGDRGALWWEYHRLITELRPTWIVGENVPGLLSSRDGADFETIVGSLTECGYGVAWAVFDAQYFGVAQRRRRVFIVGHIGGVPRPEVLALSEGLFGHPEPRRETGEATAPTIAARTRGGGWPGTDEALDGAIVGALHGPMNFRNSQMDAGRYLAFNWQATGDWVTPHDGYTDALHAGQTPAVAFAQNTRDEVRDLGEIAGALAAQPGMKQTTYLAIQGGSQQDQFVPPDGISPTLAHASNTHSGHHEPKLWNGAQVRRLTPLECERLQGFPDGWTDILGNSDTQRYRQLGNAVAVPVVEWLLKRIGES